MDSLAGLVGAGLEDGRDGVSVADGAEVFFTGWLRQKENSWWDICVTLLNSNC